LQWSLQACSATLCIELEGEQKVFEELTADEIVCMVQTQGVDVADSDECAEDDFEMPRFTLAQAQEHVTALREYMLAHMLLFSMEEMDALSGMCDVLDGGSARPARRQIWAMQLSDEHAP
jgi:hypothetical protein